MPAPTDSWDETNPPDSQDPKFGAARIRETERQIRERMVNGGHAWEVIGPSLDSDAGKHKCGTQGTTGVLELAFEEDGDLLIEARDDTAASNASRVQIGDGIDGSQPYTFVADVLQGKRDHTIIVPLVGNAGRQLGVIVENRGAGNLRVLEATAVCYGAPAGAACTIDIHKLAAGWTDPNAAGTSIVGVPPALSIAVAAFRATTVTAFADDLLETPPAVGQSGAAWVFEIDAVNSANNIAVVLRVQRTH